jgi:hypothetical protein
MTAIPDDFPVNLMEFFIYPRLFMDVVIGVDVGIFNAGGYYEVLATMTSRDVATEALVQWGESRHCNITIWQETEPSMSKNGKPRNKDTEGNKG